MAGVWSVLSHPGVLVAGGLTQRLCRALRHDQQPAASLPAGRFTQRPSQGSTGSERTRTGLRADQRPVQRSKAPFPVFQTISQDDPKKEEVPHPTALTPAFAAVPSAQPLAKPSSRKAFSAAPQPPLPQLQVILSGSSSAEMARRQLVPSTMSVIYTRVSK